MSNILGKLFTVTSFGESHGRCVGVVVDGCPAGLALSADDLKEELDRRKPDAAVGGTARTEADKPEILAGVFNGFTSGAPLCLLVWNQDVDSSSYEKTPRIARPGHADYTAYIKYGGFNDYRGGGRFSGRITAGFVMAGAVAKKLLGTAGVEVMAHTVEIGGVRAGKVGDREIRENTWQNPVRCADMAAAEKMAEVIEAARKAGDSLGGIVEAVATGVPVGLGEPIFDTLEGDLAKAVLAVPAVKGVEFGAGFDGARKKGSENNDAFALRNNKIITLSNHAGGVLGGITSGMPVVLRAAIKPTASITWSQHTVDLEGNKAVDLVIGGRHDACIVPRAVVVIEAVVAVILADFALRAGLLPRVLK